MLNQTAVPVAGGISSTDIFGEFRRGMGMLLNPSTFIDGIVVMSWDTPVLLSYSVMDKVFFSI
ncbi:hypothetical protein [Corynebacterium freiburgense]|uniref:hypothetical protein n=1 Tax=Corynebacterium freiburgense TaxID=556548 RepID=UPI0004215963|nr:hypothetical protein [Corynebacterium freiburgense]WJZ02421.1 hypothetical protein CFREI_05630 [Corynebacterium freiburgense]